MLADLAGWIKALVAAGGATAAVLFWAAGVSKEQETQAAVIERMQDSVQTDHDRVIALVQQQKQVADDVAEIKKDVKKLLERGDTSAEGRKAR